MKMRVKIKEDQGRKKARHLLVGIVSDDIIIHKYSSSEVKVTFESGIGWCLKSKNIQFHGEFFTATELREIAKKLDEYNKEEAK